MPSFRTIGHLIAKIVDVVADLDGVAEPAKQARQGVADAGVAQVADVGRLIRVDGRVLDQHFDERSIRRRCPPFGGRPLLPVEEDVQVPRRCDLGSRDQGVVRQPGRERLGDLQRWAAQDTGQLPWEVGRVVAMLHTRRLRYLHVECLWPGDALLAQ